MGLETDEFKRVELSLDTLPERDRLAIYREVIGRQMVKWEMEPSPDAPLTAQMVWRGLPGPEILTGEVGARVMGRTPDLIARDSNDGFAMSLGMGGRWRTRANGREWDANQADATLISLTEPSAVITPTRSRFLVFQMSRAALSARIPDIDTAARRSIPRDSAPMRLLLDYLNVLERRETLTSPALRRAVVEHIYDLVVRAVGVAPGPEAQVRSGGVAAAGLHAVKTDIEANLGRPDLSIDLIARWRGLSRRQIQRLFEAAGESFSAFLLERRLARVRTLLSDPDRETETVASTVFRCGFGDISHFNREFRRAYGAAPSDVRAMARKNTVEAPTAPSSGRLGANFSPKAEDKVR